MMPVYSQAMSGLPSARQHNALRVTSSFVNDVSSVSSSMSAMVTSATEPFVGHADLNPIFSKKRFCLYGFDTSQRSVLEHEIGQHAGVVLRDHVDCDYVMVPFTGYLLVRALLVSHVVDFRRFPLSNAVLTDCEPSKLVSELWLERCLEVCNHFWHLIQLVDRRC